jgi:chromosome segregation ATPase
MPSPGEMKKLQEQQKKLSEQMKKLAEQMQQKQGEMPKPGEQKKPGNEGNNGEFSKQLAQMAAEQEMIRKKMQELAEKMGDNKQRKMMQELMNKMEENETDLYNKRINQQTLLRQKDIEVKMLESEKALREQEMDEQRESKEGNTPNLMNAEQYKEYLRQKERQAELLRTVPPALKPYYRQKVTEFFNKM